ncbi:ATP-binding protein [Acidaminococcus massiliensis]|uniref:ATP-binding protein n=1 Tax=Acidaminococcus massiliensis TaxID=1852375 RepID=UPI003A4DFBC7
MEKTISGANLLLLDELSDEKFNQEECELLFRVIAERSECSSTVITHQSCSSFFVDIHK